MPEPADTPDVLQVEIRIESSDSLRRLLANPLIDFGCRASTRRRADGALVLDAFVPVTAVDALRREGHDLDVVRNVSATARERSAEVGRADLFERGRPGRRGLVQNLPRPGSEGPGWERPGSEGRGSERAE